MLKDIPVENTCRAVDVLIDEDFDTLTVCDLGETISFSQVSEDDELHNVVISLAQAERLLPLLRKILE